MIITAIQEITVTGPITNAGSSLVKYNVDLDGRMFGQIWTYKDVAWESHLFHVRTLSGFYTTRKTYAEAESAIRAEM